MTAAVIGSPRARGLRAAGAFVALIGLAISVYLTFVHYTDGAAVCAIVEGCDTVQKSVYAKLAGIPVPLLGLVGYLAILISLSRDDDIWRGVTVFLALFGFGYSVWLTYLELFVIDAICIWCVGSAICMTLLAIISLARFVEGSSANA